MLVFSRRHGEAIIIGDGIEVRILRVGRNGVSLGVIAPDAVPVHRHEIHAQISNANRAAADAAGADPSRRADIEARLKARVT